MPPRVPVDEPYRNMRGPRGFRLCRQCGAECPSARRTYCSRDCVARWRLERWPSHQRRLVEERDGGVCASCGLDYEALLRDLKELQEPFTGPPSGTA